MTEHSLPARAPKPASWVYAEDFAEEHEAARPAREAATRLGCPPLSRGGASLLTVLAKAIDARAVVEIGTGSGVSGLALFQGMNPAGILTSVDLEPEHQAEAKRTFTAAGIASQRFRLISGQALSLLPNLRDGAYDLVLIGGDKLEYVEYVAQALRLLRPGGVLVLDNALWKDTVADPRNESDETVIIREALDAIRADETLVSSLLPVGDGMVVAVKA